MPRPKRGKKWTTKKGNVTTYHIRGAGPQSRKLPPAPKDPWAGMSDSMIKKFDPGSVIRREEGRRIVESSKRPK